MAGQVRALRSSAYRSDVDGLRAIAVLLVVIFHLHIFRAGGQLVSGGFIGVDVFFVISGYLLTGIIAKEIQASKFSIAGFYERRARRILPALVALLTATTIVSLFFLFPGELLAYAKSLIAATFSYSNFYFWSVSSYFDSPDSKPLLHTWSLAVEEQFYVVLPILLVLLSKFVPRLRSSALLLLCCGSFAWSVWASIHQPTSAFYSPLSRAWELLLGSLLALDAIPAFEARWIRETAAAAGLVMIVFAAVRLTDATAFPGIAALLPCGGAFLILAAGRNGESTVGKVLAWRPLAFIGLISYSVYLWHWPLIVFSKMGLLPIPTHGLYAPAVLLLSLALGALSWRFIEQPFRSGPLRRMPRRRVFVVSACGLASCAAFSLVITIMHGFESRFSSSAVRIAAYATVPEENGFGTCFIASGYTFDDYRKELCLKQEPGKRNYLLLGDSHSAALLYGISRVLPNSHIMQASSAGCNIRIGMTERDDCSRMAAYVFGDYLETHHVDALLLTARWHHESDFLALTDTMAWCRRHGIPVYILGPVMEYNAPLPRLLAYAISRHDPALVSRDEEMEFFALDRSFRQIAEDRWHVHYASIMSIVCPAGKCMTYADPSQNVPVLFDTDHLSNPAALLVAEKLFAEGQLPTENLVQN
jgi:peptidoglycan/LPS O-acetylase OafA/YrhL